MNKHKEPIGTQTYLVKGPNGRPLMQVRKTPPWMYQLMAFAERERLAREANEHKIAPLVQKPEPLLTPQPLKPHAPEPDKAAVEAHDKAIQQQAADQARVAREAHDKAILADQARVAREAHDKAVLADQARVAREAHDKAVLADQARVAREAHDKAVQQQAADQARIAREAHDRAVLAEQARVAREASDKAAQQQQQSKRLPPPAPPNPALPIPKKP